jgi:hypothetical protein
MMCDGMLAAAVGSGLNYGSVCLFFSVFQNPGGGAGFAALPCWRTWYNKFVRLPFVNFIFTDSARGVNKADPRV